MKKCIGIGIVLELQFIIGQLPPGRLLTRTTPHWTTPTRIISHHFPLDNSHRMTLHQDDSPLDYSHLDESLYQDNSQLRQLRSPLNNSHPDDSLPGRLPIRQHLLQPDWRPHQEDSPFGKLPTGQLPLGWLSTRTTPHWIVDTVDFQDFALINSYGFSPCWIEHLFLVIIIPRSSNLVENFLFYE